MPQSSHYRTNALLRFYGVKTPVQCVKAYVKIPILQFAQLFFLLHQYK